jgi:rare lipoprotein A
LALLLLPLGACSQGAPAPDPGLGVAASPRVTAGRSVPKGGGHYKVGKPYKVAGRAYVPRVDPDYDRSGTASWYGAAFHGRRTANGEIYDMYALTAGHPTMPLPSYAYVTNRDTGRTILVRVNDRGPYVNDRLIDLSLQSARQLGFAKHGLARVRVRYAGRAPLNGDDSAERRHLAAQAWYRGSVNVAAVRSAPLTTGSLADAAAEDGRRTALGGPGGIVMDIGPFASEAEAARMSRELDAAGHGRVWRDGNGPSAAFHVRVGPLARTDAQALAHQLAGIAQVSAVVVPQ